MCLSQLINSPIANLVVGFIFGVLASWIVAHFYWRKAERVSIIQNAKDLGKDCHRCIDLLQLLVYELNQRKYTAYRLLQKLASVDDDIRVSTRKAEVSKVEKAETTSASLMNLLVSITYNKIDDKTKKRHFKQLGSLITSMNSVIAEAKALMEVEKIDNFGQYFCEAEPTFCGKTYIEFIGELEDEDAAKYDWINKKRDELRKKWIDLFISIRDRQTPLP